MGLARFISKQFIDVIDWTEEGDDVLAWRFPTADLEIQQGGMRADLQELNKKRVQILGDGEVLRTRLAAALRATHGFDSQRLLEFGIRPRRRPRRSPAPDPPPVEAVEPSS